MHIDIAIPVLCVAICATLFAFLRIRKKKRLCEETQILLNELSSFVPFRKPSSNRRPIDIRKDFSDNFNNRFIANSTKESFCAHYQDIYQKTVKLKKSLSIAHLSIPEPIDKLSTDFEQIPTLVKAHNKEIIEKRLEENRDFFDHCLDYPLDNQQRRSIVSEEDNCLVVSSAGSGKTSSIVGKVKYLTEKMDIDPKRILLISFTRKAANELSERMGKTGLRGYTFHKLALDIIGQATGEKPSICDDTDSIVKNAYQVLKDNSTFQHAMTTFFIDFQAFETESEKRIREEREELKAMRDSHIKVQVKDMDGHSFSVRSQQEKKICYALASLGVQFRYEEAYEFPVADEMHSQYRPDFSIHYEKNGEKRRLYLEHFGINEKGLVPAWFSEDRGISYEEANRLYGDGITWKKATHEKHGTRLIYTTSADFNYEDIRTLLKSKLESEGVPLNETGDDMLYALLIPNGSPLEKTFIRLAATFIALLKSSGKNLSEIKHAAELQKDTRSTYLIKNIFTPIFQYYTDTLKERGQIDFSDAISWATDICRQKHPVDYDYIIVDEFQDISVDRYLFLLALRGTMQTKLYCVGDDWQSIYRFSGSDMSLFSHFEEYFGATDLNKIETTYRFGEPAVSLSAQFIQKNATQIKKQIHPFKPDKQTALIFQPYTNGHYCECISALVKAIPSDKSVFLLGRYSFDERILTNRFSCKKTNNHSYFDIDGRKVEFLTVHKSKGLEADYVIMLQCNDDVYGFPSKINDDPSLNYLLTQSDQFPYAEERRLFYVATTRAKEKTFIVYDQEHPSIFVNEFLHPFGESQFIKEGPPNANKRWTSKQDQWLLSMYRDGYNIKDIAHRMGRSQTAIVMRLGHLGVK